MIGIEQQRPGWIEIPDPPGLMKTGGLHPLRYSFPIEVRHDRASIAGISSVAALLLAGIAAFYFVNDGATAVASMVGLAAVLAAIVAAYLRLFMLGRWPSEPGPVVALIDSEGFHRKADSGFEPFFKWAEVKRAGYIYWNDGGQFLLELERPIFGVLRPELRAFSRPKPVKEFVLDLDGFIPHKRELQLIVERMITDAGGRIVRDW